jgi:hypothetical protein
MEKCRKMDEGAGFARPPSILGEFPTTRLLPQKSPIC